MQNYNSKKLYFYFLKSFLGQKTLEINQVLAFCIIQCITSPFTLYDDIITQLISIEVILVVAIALHGNTFTKIKHNIVW